MLSAKSLFQEILDNDELFRLFCSIAAGGETQGGWENARIAALAPESARSPPRSPGTGRTRTSTGGSSARS